MKIDGFVIEGFANIPHLSLKVDELNTLIAPNGYGKSNVLNAIEFGVKFLSANELERKQMMNSRYLPINETMFGKDFLFEISGVTYFKGAEVHFLYGYQFKWSTEDMKGIIKSEYLKIRSFENQRFKQLISRVSEDECLITPSVAGRCKKSFKVSNTQLALNVIAVSSEMYLYEIVRQIAEMQIPKLETLDNPDSYFSVDDTKGISTLGGMTLSEYLYKLKTEDFGNYSILKDGLLQLIPSLEDFSPEAIHLSNGQEKIYDVTVKEKHCVHTTSIRQLSSGSKRMIFLFSLCVAAKKQNIPLIMLEEPENSVHPRFMENLLISLQNYASDTKILMTSHSPYLVRYLKPEQMFFGLPNDKALAKFAQVNPAKLKYLYQYAGELELTLGEFMFDFMLDLEDDTEKIEKFFL